MTLRDLLPWGESVNRIQAKLTAAQERVNELTQKRSDLALDAALDDGAAKKQLEKIGQELSEAERAAANLQMALQQAQQKASEQEAARATKAEEDRQQKIKDLIAERASLVGNVEDSVLALERDLKALYELGKQIDATVGGPMLTGAAGIGWQTEVKRLLGLEVVRDRLLHFAGPRLHMWLSVPNKGMNPQYKERSFREIEQEAVDVAVYGKQPKARTPRTEEAVTSQPDPEYFQTAHGWKTEKELAVAGRSSVGLPKSKTFIPSLTSDGARR